MADQIMDPQSQRIQEAEKSEPPDLRGAGASVAGEGRRSGFQPPSRARWWILLLAAILAVAGVAYWLHTANRESTDDAQVDGHLHPIGSRVSGTILRLLVQDNQLVEAGTVLVQLDPKDFQVAVDQARASMAEAEANMRETQGLVPITSTTTGSQLTSAEASVREVEAGVHAALKTVEVARARLITAQARVREVRANAENAARDLERMKVLIAKEEISQQQFDAVSAAAEGSRAQVESTESQVKEAEEGVRLAESQLGQQQARLERAHAEVASARTAPQQVGVTRIRAESSSAKFQQKKAALEQAELNLQYTTVRAPIRGIVSQRGVEVGQIVQIGQPLLAIVPLDPDQIWVTANFKETQLINMRPGQKAIISVDAYGGREYEAHVDSIASTTGARASLLPPENATGNYVKVVQRIPVRIVLEKDQDPQHLLRPGMSVFPTVFTN